MLSHEIIAFIILVLNTIIRELVDFSSGSRNLTRQLLEEVRVGHICKQEKTRFSCWLLA